MRDLIEEEAFAAFATMYPHEAHAEWPERFLAYAVAKTGQTREVIERILRETEEGVAPR